MKASAIYTNIMVIPLIQTKIKRYLKKNKPFKKWRYNKIKKYEAPLKCLIRRNHPCGTSNIIYCTLLKAKLLSGLKCIDNKRPVIIWCIRTIPSKLPRFHTILILLLVGESKSIDWAKLRRPAINKRSPQLTSRASI